MTKFIQIILAIAAWCDYEIWQMDVKMAFLNGFVEEEIYMDQPEGFTSVGEEQKVCHLQRSIYGLKQASRSWNIHFDEVIRSYDFIKNDFDPCVYEKVSGSSVAFLVLYVDDILLIGNDVKMLGDTKAWLSTQFSMKDLGEASYILGIKIIRDRSKRILGMTQTSYVEKVLKRFKMKNSKRGFLPVRHGVKLSKKQSPKTDEELRKIFDIPYASAWAAYSMLCSAQGQMSLRFERNEHISVPSIVEPVVIFCDNNGAIAQAKEPRSHHRSKHILRRYHLVKEMVGRGDVRMDQVTSAENMADPLTKPVSQIAHAQHLGKMGFMNMSDWL
ncbi:UNVERIFIED_CONTAM: Retrovirus-related Pol polyprotein from transposon RE1 [Sesamum latifolium]|uniref:Retrovirus-related Pol polyprotein from transposon RE1 n=1 Tax=Sesamum latifolium TaxID=2727402 RepID=A0AAW2YB12_9LAMI